MQLLNKMPFRNFKILVATQHWLKIKQTSLVACISSCIFDIQLVFFSQPEYDGNLFEKNLNDVNVTSPPDLAGKTAAQVLNEVRRLLEIFKKC